MRWKNRRLSANVEDRRSMGGRRLAMGGGIGSLVIIGLAVLLGGDPAQLMQLLGQNAPPGGGQPAVVAPEDDEIGRFVSVVLADTEEVWQQLFRNMGQEYREPKLVLFRDSVESACGFQNAAVGPFYCPADEKVYIDLSFYQELKNQHGAPGDFAQAYVIAHEVGHHVQKLMGISDRIHDLQRRASKQQANELSVRMELQADFFAGVWAHHAQRNWQILEQGDVEEALGAASAIGDDRLQMEGRGYIVPESFTHGTSEQRSRWFLRGLKTGDVSLGNTFEANPL